MRLFRGIPHALGAVAPAEPWSIRSVILTIVVMTLIVTPVVIRVVRRR